MYGCGGGWVHNILENAKNLKIIFIFFKFCNSFSNDYNLISIVNKFSI